MKVIDKHSKSTIDYNKFKLYKKQGQKDVHKNVS